MRLKKEPLVTPPTVCRIDGLTRLSWLPDETVFSLSSRVHRWLGNADPAITSKALFALPRGGVHDLPGFIDRWIEAGVSEPIARPQDILFNRTLLGFYRPFLEPSVAAATVAQLRVSSMGALKFKLGLLTSRFGADHPLKACASCVLEDQAAYHTAYWHQQHQWPGVWSCVRHGERLIVSDQRIAAGQRFAWCLPDPRSLRAVIAPQNDVSASALLDSALKRFSSFAIGAAALPEATYLGSEHLCMTYRQRLQTLGLLSLGQRLMHAPIGRRLTATFAPLASVGELDHLAGLQPEVARQATGMLVRPQRRCHPLRHVALMYALFEDWEDFWRSYGAQPSNNCASSTSHQVTHRTSNADQDYMTSQRKRFLSSIAQGDSVSAAASTSGVDTSTGLAWATQAGIPVKKRPKLLKPDIRKPLLLQLQRGVDKSIVASRAGVSVQTITRVLRTEVGLSAAWHAARHANAQTEARLSWSRSCREYQRDGFLQVRHHAAAAYAWLYRHDKAWLRKHLPNPELRTSPRRGSVNWTKRDHELATRVRDLQQQGVLESPRLWEIYLKVPDLKAKLNQINELPQTRAAVEALIGRQWMRR